MEITRRDLAAAGALAIGAASLLQSGPAMADSADAAAVDKAVEALRKALLEADKSQLEKLTAEQLSYGHSSGKVESKPQFVEGVMTRKAIVKSIAFPEVAVAVVGDAAIVRHLWESESETDGKPTSTKIGVLQVWLKQDNSWELLARAAYTLPQPVEKS